jgi:hypothetical protein
LSVGAIQIGSEPFVLPSSCDETPNHLVHPLY